MDLLIHLYYHPGKMPIRPKTLLTQKFLNPLVFFPKKEGKGGKAYYRMKLAGRGTMELRST